MASILKVDTITGVTTAGVIAITGEGNSTTTNLQQGLCKAFARGTNAAVREDSFNLSSGTDFGTGNYTYAFTNNMATVNYVLFTNSAYATLSATGTLTTSQYDVRLFSRADSLTTVDDVNHSQASGDLA